MIIITCPKCGYDLKSEVLTCNPPIHKDYCPNCGWSHSNREENVRVPFIENESPYATLDSFQNSPCVTCGNNPKNGGSGICHCTLGQPQITC